MEMTWLFLVHDEYTLGYNHTSNAHSHDEKVVDRKDHEENREDERGPGKSGWGQLLEF